MKWALVNWGFVVVVVLIIISTLYLLLWVLTRPRKSVCTAPTCHALPGFPQYWQGGSQVLTLMNSHDKGFWQNGYQSNTMDLDAVQRDNSYTSSFSKVPFWTRWAGPQLADGPLKD